MNSDETKIIDATRRVGVWLGRVGLGNSTQTAAGEPEHVVVEPLAALVQSYQPFLHVALLAAGSVAKREGAQTIALLRSTSRNWV